MDIVDRATRSRMMSGIRGKNTVPELVVRSYFHRQGLRFRLNVGKLPGKPDLVFAKYHVVVFVHGCFWHKHECRKFVWPKSRPDFWKKKLDDNAERDRRNLSALRELGWNAITLWECEINDASLTRVLQEIVNSPR